MTTLASTISPAPNSVSNDAASVVSFVLSSNVVITSASLLVRLNGGVAITGGAFQAGYTGSIVSSGGGTILTVTIATHPVFTELKTGVYVQVADAGPSTLNRTWSFGVRRDNVSNLTAKSYPEGKRIDLAWTNPAGVTQLKIRRSRYSYCQFVDDAGTDIYTGAPITGFVDGVYTGPLSTTNAALDEGTFYYYSIFVSYSAGPYVWLHDRLSGEVEGLSIRDYNTENPHYVYQMLPAEERRADADPGRGTDRWLLRDYCSVIQSRVNVYRGWADSLEQLKDPETMPAGRLGVAENQNGLLQAESWARGVPPERSFDSGVLRRIAIGFVPVASIKGTCPSLTQLTKLLTEWDSRCDEIIEPNCGIQRLFHLWDAESYLLRYIPAVDGDNAAIGVAGEANFVSSKIFKADGVTVAPTMPTVDPDVAFVIDEMGTFACVASTNAPVTTTQKLLFSNPAAMLRKEIFGTGTGAALTFTINTISTISYPWQFPTPAAAPKFGTNAWAGHKLMDSTGAIFTIASSQATSGANTVLTLASGTPATGSFSLAAKFDPSGVTFATRKPLLVAKFYVGEFSLTYDPRWDTRLMPENSVGPWTYFTSLGSTTGALWAPSPADLIIWVANQHALLGTATSTSTYELGDSTRTWTTDQWRGYYVLPNWNQRKLYRVVGNNATTLFVDVSEGGGVSTVAIAGANYVLLTERNAIKYSRLSNLLQSFMPLESKAFVKFESA